MFTLGPDCLSSRASSLMKSAAGLIDIRDRNTAGRGQRTWQVLPAGCGNAALSPPPSRKSLSSLTCQRGLPGRHSEAQCLRGRLRIHKMHNSNLPSGPRQRLETPIIYSILQMGNRGSGNQTDPLKFTREQLGGQVLQVLPTPTPQS